MTAWKKFDVWGPRRGGAGGAQEEYNSHTPPAADTLFMLTPTCSGGDGEAVSTSRQIFYQFSGSGI